MFRSYLAIFRQLSSFRNRHTALVLKPKCFNAIELFSFTPKEGFFMGTYLYSCGFCVFRVILFSPMNTGMALLSLFLCTSLVCMFPVIECMSLSYI
jgi:hypothetical protein